jgi:hypothetical protein
MFVDAAILVAMRCAFRSRTWLVTAYSHLWLLVAIPALVYVAAWLSNPISASVS